MNAPLVTTRDLATTLTQAHPYDDAESSCGCGVDLTTDDPWTEYVVHVVEALVSEGVVATFVEALTAAALDVEAYHDGERARLEEAIGGNPYAMPLLSNWLGGILEGAKVLRGRADA